MGNWREGRRHIRYPGNEVTPQTAHDPICPTFIGKGAQKRCERLLRACPAVEAIELNASLQGERTVPERAAFIHGWTDQPARECASGGCGVQN